MPELQKKEEIKRELSQAAAKKYDLHPKAPIVFHDTTLGRIDLRSISAQQADKIAGLRKNILVEKKSSGNTQK